MSGGRGTRLPRLLLQCLWLALALVWARAPAAAEPLRVGLTHDAAAAPFFIALDQRYFEDAGVDLRLRWFADDGATVAAAVKGEVDVAFTGLDARFYRLAAARGLRIIASERIDRTGFPQSLLIVSAAARARGLTRVSALGGRVIGFVDEDAGLRYAVERVGERFGVREAYRSVFVGSGPASARALAEGRVDALALPLATARRLARPTDSALTLSDFAVWQSSVMFATAPALTGHRDEVQRLVRAYQRGASDYSLNFLQYDDGGDFIPGPRYAHDLDLIARQARMPSAQLAVSKPYCDRLANLDVADIRAQVAYWQEHGRLDGQVKAEDLVDSSLLFDVATASTSAR